MSNAKYIVIAFTLKGQEFEHIAPVIEMIARINPAATLIHGFMSRADVEKKGFKDDINDKFEELFGNRQISFYEDNAGVNREAMKNFAYENKAEVYVIGNVKDGVKEELIAYIKANLSVNTIKIDYSIKSSEDYFESLFNEADLVSFGNYLLSPERDLSLDKEKNPDVANWVHDADVANWKEKEKQKNIDGKGNEVVDAPGAAEWENGENIKKNDPNIPAKDDELNKQQAAPITGAPLPANLDSDVIKNDNKDELTNTAEGQKGEAGGDKQE